METATATVTPVRLLQGVFVLLAVGGGAVNLLFGRSLAPSILLGAWIGSVGAILCLVGFVFYLGLVALEVV